MNAPESSSSRRGGRRSLGSRIGMGLLGALLLLGVVVYATRIFGLVRGEEFAPETFKRRSFIYYEIPLVGIQVSPITRDDITGSLEDYLIKHKLVAANTKTSDPKSIRWDLVSSHRGEVLSGHGEAQILCHYLDATDPEDENIWLEWSKEHGNLAKVLWPMVAKVSHQELYIFVPQLLSLAGNASSAQELKTSIDEMLAREYLRIAHAHQQMNHHEAAVELFTEALAHNPRAIEALEGRAESLAAVGKQERASADLAQAQELQKRL